MIKTKQTAELTAELTAENKARAIVYNFLSSLFAKEVNKDLVAQLTSEQGQSFLSSLALEPTLAPHIKVINAKLAGLNSEESLLELAADFCGLFLVDGRTSVSPYAGQYLSSKQYTEKPPLFGELHQEMTEFLTNSKMQIHSDFPEPGDHLAVILAYIAHLCVATDAEHQHGFISTYLMTWLSDFAKQVKKHDHGVFYSAVAGLTQEWLKIEMDYLMKH